MLNKDLARGRIYSVWGTLDKIPTDLHAFFHDIMTKNAESKDKHDGLLLSVQWILHSQRPLTPEELYFGLLCGKKLRGRFTFKPADWQDCRPTLGDIHRFITDASKGLIKIAGFCKDDLSPCTLRRKTPLSKDGSPLFTIQFIHNSVRSFLHAPEGHISVVA